MDSFDEFEFKPLSRGLGFHKKPTKLESSFQKTRMVQDHLNKKIPVPPPKSFFDDDLNPQAETTYESLLASLSEPSKVSSSNRSHQKPSWPGPLAEEGASTSLNRSVSLTQTFPREGEGLNLSPDLTSPSSDVFGTEIFPEPIKRPDLGVPLPKNIRQDIVDKSGIGVSSDIFKSSRPKEGVQRGGHNSPPLSHLKSAPIGLRSTLLDTLVVLAMALIFLLSLLTVTKVDLLNVWRGSQQDMMMRAVMAVLYIAVYQMYVVISRSFFGRTLGEWTFDFQLGSDEQQQKATYPLKVLWRSFVIMMTGVFVLPLLSLIFRKDLASYVSGLQLFEHR